MTKIAVAIIHGVGAQLESDARDSMKRMKNAITRSFKRRLDGKAKKPEKELVIEPIYWANVVQPAENELWRALKNTKRIGPFVTKRGRQPMITLLGDAAAYQRGTVTNEEQDTPMIYDLIHAEVARGIRKLAEEAGEGAPLCIIAHSLGTVIASNYIYDLQRLYDMSGNRKDIIPYTARQEMGDTPLERGETLTHLYTMGSPLLLWTLRYQNFDSPIRIPARTALDHFPGVDGEWVNFYDEADIIGYPLRVHEAYRKEGTVRVDRVVKAPVVKNWISLGLLSHVTYWGDREVVEPIASSLADCWLSVNAD